MSNANFLGKIENNAGQLTRVNASNASLATAQVGNLTAANILLNQLGYRESVLVAFAPTGFASLGVAGAITMTTQAAGPAATGTGDSRLATLPLGAFVTKVQADNNGVTVAGSAGFTVSLATAGATGALALLSPLTAGLNATGGVQRNIIYGADSTGANGAAVGVLDPAALSGTGRQTLVVRNDGAANTAGAIRVVVHYYDLEPQ